MNEPEKTISLPVKSLLAIGELAIALIAGWTGSAIHSYDSDPVNNHRVDTLETRMEKADDLSEMERKANRENSLANQGDIKLLFQNDAICKERYLKLELRVTNLEDWIWIRKQK